MPRQPRKAFGGEVYHVMNRGNCRMDIFRKPSDYLAFLELLEEGRRRTGMRILAFCLMPNHWHMVLWPKRDEDLSAFVRWVSTTHVRRWREHRNNVGEGHLYQGRFKNFPIERTEQLYRVLRYVEGNARRAKRAKTAEAWPYGSLYNGEHRPEHRVEITAWPVPRPRNWIASVNRPIKAAELNALRLHVQRNRPLGSDAWVRRSAKRMGLEWTLRDRGRPPKVGKSSREVTK